MRIFGLNRRIIRVLLGCQYAHMLEYRAEIALWALSGVLPFIMLSVWSGSDARSGLGLDGVALDRYFLSAFLVRQFSVVWVVYAFEEDALQGRLSPYLLQPLHPLSQLWHTLSLSAYVPVLHEATHDAPCLNGLLETHVTQSVDSPPEHVAQSAWQAAQRRPRTPGPGSTHR